MDRADETLLEKFKKIITMSNRVAMDVVAKSLSLSKDALFEKLVDWNDHVPFKIEGNDIIVSDMAGFIDCIDAQFATWEDVANAKADKLGMLKPANSTIPPAGVFVDRMAREQAERSARVSRWRQSFARKNRSRLFRGEGSIFEGYTVPHLPDDEVEVLATIEEMIGKTLMLVDVIMAQFASSYFGFQLEQHDRTSEHENSHVVGIGMPGCGLSDLPTPIKNLRRLHTLHVNNNHLTRLPEWVENMHTLKMISLEGNPMDTFPPQLAALNSLKVLTIPANMNVPQGMMNNPSISITRVDKNKRIWKDSRMI